MGVGVTSRPTPGVAALTKLAGVPEDMGRSQRVALAPVGTPWSAGPESSPGSPAWRPPRSPMRGAVGAQGTCQARPAASTESMLRRAHRRGPTQTLEHEGAWEQRVLDIRAPGASWAPPLITLPAPLLPQDQSFPCVGHLAKQPT